MTLALPMLNRYMYCIPYLYFDGEVIDYSISRSKLDTQSGFMILLKSILRKS